MKTIVNKIIDISNTFIIKSLIVVLLLSVSSLPTFAGGDETNGNVTEYPPFTLSVENLRISLKNAGVQHSEIVLRQAILETGWFKCTSCSLSKNNIFGFWYKKKYIQFDNWKDCVAYYKRWQDKHYKGGDYYAFLKRVGFATDPSYIKRLKSIKGI